MLNRLMMLAVAGVLCLSAGSLLAQDNNNGGNNGGGGGGRNRGNFDPAQFQQRMMDNTRDRLGFTNDTEWAAVQPLVQKVFDARMAVGFGGMGRMRNRGGDGENRRPAFGPPNPEADALQAAIDANAPAAQIKSLLEKYRVAQKAKEAKLKEAQETLRKVLTAKQEAQATLLGLVQ